MVPFNLDPYVHRYDHEELKSGMVHGVVIEQQFQLHKAARYLPTAQVRERYSCYHRSSDHYVSNGEVGFSKIIYCGSTARPQKG